MNKTIETMKRVVVILLVCTLLVGTLSACSNNVDSSTDKNNTTASPASNEEPKVEEGEKIAEDLTLTYWVGISAKVSAVVKGYDEMPVFQQLEKNTGIHIEFQHPPIGQESEQFNLMVASQDLPDMIYWDWSTFPGGPAKAIKDNTIIALNDAFDSYAPDILATFEKYPQAKKDAMMDDGTFYMVPFIKPDKSIASIIGFQLRGDWLKGLGLEVPTTIDEWYTTLTAFKDNDVNGNGDANDEIPFVAKKLPDLAYFASAWGMIDGFYLKGNEIKYGPIEEGYEQYITTMHKWYEEGLIDSEFAMTDAKQFVAKVTGNIAGSYFGMVSGDMGTYMSTVTPDQPNFELIAAPNPIGPAGKSYNIHPSAARVIPGPGIGITSKNKHVQESIEWANYGYTDEGDKLLNFGIEGESYTMVDGVPTYTDMIFKNPDGLKPSQAVGIYTLTHSGHALYASGYLTQMLIFPQQNDAIKVWGLSSTELIIPAITPTVEESSELASLVNDITTYKDEMVYKFIMGQEPLDKFDAFVETIKGMQIDKAIEIQQGALARYSERK